MTPDERQMITGLFDRMRQQGSVDKDREAESLIRDAVRQLPDAPYMLVQTALVQDMALQQSEGRIRELEDRIRDLEQQARPQGQSQGGGSFLGGLFGSGVRPATSYSGASTASSVPAAGRPPAGYGSAPQRPGSPWGQAAAPAPQPMQQMQPMPMAPSGGGFMRSAMSTAAGVAGGMLAANAISNMFGGHSGAAHASGFPPMPLPDTGQHDVLQQDPQQATYSDDNNDPGTYDSNDPGYDSNDPGYDDNDPGYDDGGSTDI